MDNQDAFYALAESWASIDGKLEKFHACRDDAKLDETAGYYIGYMTEAEEMIKRLERRGFTVVPCVRGGLKPAELKDGVKYYFSSGSVDTIPSEHGERRFAGYNFNDESA